MPRFSLILATVGRTAELDRLFDSLVAQTCRDFEIIVVDQNPDGRLLPHIDRARRLGLDIITRQLEPPNLAAARNTGIAAAQGDWLCFPDDDCWYEPDTLANVLDACRQNPRLQGVVACWVEQAAAGTEVGAAGKLELAAWRNFRGGEASSICLFFSRALVNSLGGFDVRLGVGQWYGAGEESDYVLRALAADAELARCLLARVHHAYALPTEVDDWRAAFGHLRRRSRGTGALYAKHRLSPYVILRGCTAPVVLPLVRGKGFKVLTGGLATALGRIEGFTRWRWGKS